MENEEKKQQDAELKKAVSLFGCALLAALVSTGLIVTGLLFALDRGGKNAQSKVENFLDTPVTVSGYTVDGTNYTVEKPDCWLLSTAWQQAQVSRVEIVFSQPITENLNIAVYAAPNGEILGEQHRVDALAQKGDSAVAVSVDKAVSALRVDIGDTKGQIFSLSQILVTSTKNTVLLAIKSKIAWIFIALTIVATLIWVRILRPRFFKKM